ncbi:glycosyltransferase [Paracoccus sp. P2]|uniref:glycosyltransferase n=1 Tax=Paracoccus sp. P2 TaxID=3248840 RepID=UPI00391F75C9
MLNSHTIHPRVAVLLASHNGEAYIKEQIDSILSQDGVSIHIFMSDDGSTDGTLCIAERYKSQCLTVLPPKRFGNSGQNFLYLLREAPWQHFDYLAFSDQDDIWLPNKVGSAIRKLKDGQYSGYSANVMAFWPDGKYSLVKKSHPQRRRDYLFESGGPGNTFVLPVKSGVHALNLIRSARSEIVNKIESHDWLIYAIVRENCGRWLIDENPMMYYRQHDKNVSGAGLSFKRLARKLKMLFGNWYIDQVKSIAEISGASCWEVDFINRPSVHKIPIMLKKSKNLRRRSRDSIILSIALTAYALRSAFTKASYTNSH